MSIFYSAQMKIKRIHYWFLRYWSIIASIIIGVGFVCILQVSFSYGFVTRQNSNETIELISLLSSIMTGIVIAILASKVIQLRQEKISLKPDLWELTRKLHYFRKIIHEFFHNNDFWPQGLPNYVKQNYPNLSYYNVRDIIYVDREISEEARKFIQDEKFGEIIKQAFLEMKSFLLPLRVFDETVYSEFDVDIMYSSSILDKWQEYDCGNMIWYLFEDKYSLYEGHI